MKTVIYGLTYNTETAKAIASIGSDGTQQGDFRHWYATLYKTQKGRFFMEGSGGASSPFSVSCGQNSWSGDSGIRALVPEQALAYAENSDMNADDIAEHFGDMIEEA